jgi:hypothetical protein
VGPGATTRGGAATPRPLRFTFLGRVALEPPERLAPVESGDLAGAAAYRYFAALGFELPADSNWLLAAAALADTCVTLGDADGAAELARLLEPWADRHVILNCYGGGGAYWGPVAHHLGRLALLRHDRCRGEELLRRAMELSECARAPQFVARARAELARLG